jgi:hypothetical protein
VTAQLFSDHRETWGCWSTSEWEGDDLKIVTHYLDEQPLLDSNAAKRSAGRDYYAADNEMWRVASIPISVQYEWLTKHGVDLGKDEHWPAVKRLLNSSDYRYLKTADIII